MTTFISFFHSYFYYSLPPRPPEGYESSKVTVIPKGFQKENAIFILQANCSIFHLKLFILHFHLLNIYYVCKSITYKILAYLYRLLFSYIIITYWCQYWSQMSAAVYRLAYLTSVYTVGWPSISERDINMYVCIMQNQGTQSDLKVEACFLFNINLAKQNDYHVACKDDN